MTAVYSLEDEVGQVRYIGVSKNPPTRLDSHIRESRRGETHRCRWIRSVIERGFTPVMRILEWVEDWSEGEMRWIAYFRLSGAPLVNGNDGGLCMKQARIPARFPTIKRTYRVLEANLRSKYATARSIEALQASYRIYCELVARHKTNGTLDWLETRLRSSRFICAND